MSGVSLSVRGDAVHAFLLTDLYESAEAGRDLAYLGGSFADDARAFDILDAGWDREAGRLVVQRSDLEFLAGYVVDALNAIDTQLEDARRAGRHADWDAERRRVERGVHRAGSRLHDGLWRAIKAAA